MTNEENLTERITARLDKDQLAAAKRMAKDNGVKKPSVIVRMALNKLLVENGYLPDQEAPAIKKTLTARRMTSD